MSDFLCDDECFGGCVKVSYFSNDGIWYSGSVYGKLNEDWGVLGYYSILDRDNMEDGDGNEIYGIVVD